MTQASLEMAPSIRRKYRKSGGEGPSVGDVWVEMIPGSGDSGKLMRQAIAHKLWIARQTTGPASKTSAAERLARATRSHRAFAASGQQAKTILGHSKLNRRSWSSSRTGSGTRTQPVTRPSFSVSSLDRAAELLARLTADSVDLGQPELRMQTARILRRAAVDQSQISPRVASISLLLSDTLVNSLTIDLTSERRQALRLGLDLLMDSFVPQEKEEELFRSLLNAGLEITGPFNHEEFTDLVARLSE